MRIRTERDLAAVALALGARAVAGWSPAETALVRDLPKPNTPAVDRARAAIRRGRDPLGDAFCLLRSPETRRPSGATYTPRPIVQAMVTWAVHHAPAARIVDPGVGSARFLVAAGRELPDAALVGVDIDPLAALLARAHLACAGLAARAQVLVGDFREIALPRVDGRTIYVGNPPYVRHHLIQSDWKRWLVGTAATVGVEHASQLAGLHVHFFMATAAKAHAGDFGAFVTAAEWLDVNYGRSLRELFVGRLGGRSLTIVDPAAQPFPDATTTAAIATFEIGSRPAAVRLRRAGTRTTLHDLERGRGVPRERLETAPRWTVLLRRSRARREGHVELGELCRVHRGQVTGANRVWIAGPHSQGLPASVLVASVTKARELFAAGDALRDATALRRVIDLPVDLDAFDNGERGAIERFLQLAATMGADRGYIATRRKAWYSVGLREPAPILSTYMARRPPAFVRNLAAARHINIAHGIYPRDAMSDVVLGALATFLSRSVSQSDGRTYAGGLTKFEPKEIERLLVPGPDALARQRLDIDRAG